MEASAPSRKRFDWRGLDRRDKQALGLLLLIVALGLGLRLTGIQWSLPDARHPLATYHPDERVNLNAALQADIAHGQFDIKFYNYGTFYFYLANLAQTIGAGYGVIPKLPAAEASPEAQQAGQAATNAGLFLAGRLVSALLGTATLPVLYLLGRRLFGRRAGLIAALFYGVAPLAVLHAHFFTVDVTATFFVSLALLWSARLLTSQTWSDYALAALWAGLAAATKYNAGLVMIAPIVAHFLNKAPNACRKHRAAQFVVLVTIALVTFLIACPGPWLNFDAFWNGLPGYPSSGLRYELIDHSRGGHGYLFTNTGNGWWYHLAVSLPFGLGLGLLIAGLIGLVSALRQRTKADWLLLAFFLVYFGISGLSNVRFARYMLPLFPVFCLWAARFLMALRLPSRTDLIIGLIVPILPLYSSVYLLRCMTTPDPRDAAANFLEQHAPQGAQIAFATVPWFYSPPLSPRFGELAAPRRAQAAQEVTRFRLRIPTEEWDRSVYRVIPDYIVVSDIETMHPYTRLHLEAPTDFIKLIPFPNWRTFSPPVTQDPLYQSEIIPEDILYVRPTITVYFRSFPVKR
jgi:4-amino-4-deoxy-L-arabinose transferase-like glycosyltransferase